MKLAPWERYMVADDTRRYAMTCHIRFWFSGNFIRDVFEDSLVAALERHPLLRARLKRGIWCDRWEIRPADLTTQLVWSAGESQMNWGPQQAPDFRVRFYVLEESKETCLIVQFHHAVCDGIGIFQAVEDLLLAYHKFSGGQADLPALRPERLAERHLFHLTPKQWRSRRRDDLRRIGRFFRRCPVAVNLTNQPQTSLTATAALKAAHRLLLSPEETQRVLAHCKVQSVTLNDFLLASLFATLSRCQLGSEHDTFRLAVPTSLRLAEDATMPAANLVSMVFLDRTRAEIHDFPQLVRTIGREMTEIKTKRMGLAMIRVVNWMGISRRLLRVFLRFTLTNTTAVLTNLGRPFAASPLLVDGRLRAGNMVLTGLDTMPPLRPKTRISLSVNGYGDHLSLTCRYDTTTVSEAAALAFLEAFKTQIQTV